MRVHPSEEGTMAYKLLLADDSITIQKVVELVLAEEGFEIKAANNGEEALSAVVSFKPDVILADIEMPKMNGYQLCEEIKTNPETKHIPIILLAGAFEPLDEELAKNVGADDHIVKPFESQELIGKIKTVITPRKGAKEVPAPKEEETFEALETVGVEEDLWAMEDILSEQVEAEVVEETPLEEVAVGESMEFVEEAEAEIQPEKPVGETFATKQAAAPHPPYAPSVPIEGLSKDEFSRIFRSSVEDKVAAAVTAANLKEAVAAALAPHIRDSVEKIVWEVAPDLVEKLLKEMLQGSLASLSKEVEKVIWETVPDLAEGMIKKEIEKIKSEL